jgi:hypothetical protein
VPPKSLGKGIQRRGRRSYRRSATMDPPLDRAARAPPSHQHAVDDEQDDRADDGGEPRAQVEELVDRVAEIDARAIRPPSSPPATPIRMVTIMPPGSSPGRITFAITPATRPSRIQPMMPVFVLSSEQRSDSPRRRRVLLTSARLRNCYTAGSAPRRIPRPPLPPRPRRARTSRSTSAPRAESRTPRAVDGRDRPRHVTPTRTEVEAHRRAPALVP